MERFVIQKSAGHFNGWPDLVQTPAKHLLCVFTECAAHTDHTFSQINCCESCDEGRSWSASRPVTDRALLDTCGYYYNNASLRYLKDGRLVLLVDRIYGSDENVSVSKVVMYTSHDDGQSWDCGVETPCIGIVPDRLLESSSGRWMIACHWHNQATMCLEERLWYSDNQGESWVGPVLVGSLPERHLCEASLLEADGIIVALMRENSWLGLPAYRAVSRDNGAHWSSPVAFPLPGCHRPRAGFLQDGRIFISYRFTQGGQYTTQNLFGALTEPDKLTGPRFEDSGARILPLDYDCAEVADTGYSGWVELANHDLYIVNYGKAEAKFPYVYGFRLPSKALYVCKESGK